ncbi:MAG: hypothetical protein Q8R11_00260 [bacterium]|nr:hypothetical protein [bacterium]
MSIEIEQVKLQMQEKVRGHFQERFPGMEEFLGQFVTSHHGAVEPWVSDGCSIMTMSSSWGELGQQLTIVLDEKESLIRVFGTAWRDKADERVRRWLNPWKKELPLQSGFEVVKETLRTCQDNVDGRIEDLFVLDFWEQGKQVMVIGK